MPASPSIRVGVGGWTFEPWRGLFYPQGVKQKDELAYMSRKLTSIEVNGTYYGTIRRDSFVKWRDATPDDFVFALKAPRFATNRRVLAEAGPSITRFLDSGVLELKHKLGPINWQFMATKKFDPDDFAAFLALLPKEAGGRRLRHAVEVRHESFCTPAFVALLRKHNVAAVTAGDAKFPLIADATADFMYARLMGTTQKQAKGYAAPALARWAARAKQWAQGEAAEGLAPLAPAPKGKRARDVYLYVIAGYKPHNPAAAMALIERVRKGAA